VTEIAEHFLFHQSQPFSSALDATFLFADAQQGALNNLTTTLADVRVLYGFIIGLYLSNDCLNLSPT
jgi:hypothetical protein